MAYDHNSIEKKWQKFWSEEQTFKTENNTEKPKKYILDMFPYPSGAGLHVGHPKGYTATDIVSRYYHANDYNVLHTMGFDAFGLPAENYAIKTGTHPAITTADNINVFIEQLKRLGFSYDWDRMVDTTDPEYYKWTQWIFLELFKKGLAYEQDLPINYCPSCKTGLANEEVTTLNTCDRCGTRVERRPIRQWVLRITEYADRLLSDIDTLDWPEGIKEMQRNWIGKSEGCEFRMLKKIEPQRAIDRDFHLSPATKEDFVKILQIRNNTGFHTIDFLQEQFFIAKKNDIIAGFIRIQKYGDYTEIGALYVGEEFRGDKLGYRLISYAIEHADTIEIYIDCKKELQGYYERFGFTILSSPMDFQIEKLKKVWSLYGKNYTEQDILDITIFMKIKKESLFLNKPVALILHGWENEGATSVHFHAWQTGLKKELEKAGYEVFMPNLPDPARPNLERQLEFLEQYRSKMDENSIVIAHSMGGFLGMHFVERLGKKIGKLICVAPAFNGLIDVVDWSSGMSEESWNIGSESMRKSYNPEMIRKNVHDWQVFLSKNDPYVPYSEAKKYFDTIGVAHSDRENAGHFNDSDNPTLDIFLNAVVESISVYTTRIDTVYGMTYVVMAPDHPSVGDFIADTQRSVCEEYIEGIRGKSDQDRTNEGKEKTGVFTGSYVVNPYNGESVPLWIADYVLGSYGTGAVMAVPAHDERDFEFAKKYDLPIRQSIAPKIIGEGPLTPREGVETVWRTFVNSIIEFEGKFLLLKESHGYKFVGGGFEEGENLIDAYKRELIEETGYDDFEIREFILNSAYYGFAFRNPKNRNDEGFDYPFAYIKLNSLRNRGISDKEKSLHSVEWVEKEDVKKLLISNGHQYAWKAFLGNNSLVDDGYLMNSGEFSRLSSSEARRIFTEKAEKEGFGKKKVNYKLRDWLFSRQRYWGEPIPLIHISDEDYTGLPRMTVRDGQWPKELYAGLMGFKKEGSNPCYVPRSIHEAFILDCNDIADIEKRGEYLMIVQKKNDDIEFEAQILSKIYTGITGKLVIDSSLPLTLPAVEKYEPAGDGHSPLATVPDWVNVKFADNLVGKRETNTMPQWGGSCWYYLRYMDSKNPDAIASREALDYWGMVDEYVGGAEHAVLHLLYARFWHKVLYDIGVVPYAEPFQKLTNVGMILAYAYERPDGGLVAVDMVEERDGKYFEKGTDLEVKQVVAKMSKSLKNVVNPNDIVREYGADTLRLYEMSMSAFTDTAPWNPDAIIGVRRFLDKAYSTVIEGKNQTKDDMKAMKLLHKTIKKVGEDIVAYKFNTAISALQILLNEGVPVDEEFATEWKSAFAILLHPFAPHMAEELYSFINSSRHSDEGRIQASEASEHGSFVPQDDRSRSSIYEAKWPEYDDFMLIDDEVTIAIQVAGKLRGTLSFLNGVAQEEVSIAAMADPNIAKWLEGKIVVKEIFIPNKMLSIVVKDA